MEDVVELVAHRAGNVTSSIASALDAADTVELDVHLFRGRIEVRHAKVIWPFRIHWVPRRSQRSSRVRWSSISCNPR